MSPTRRIVAFVLGLLLLPFGLLGFTLMCGNNGHVAGALLGGAAGLLIGWRRRSRRLDWYAFFGSVALSLAGAGLERAGAGSCAGLWNTLGAGVVIGAGLGLMGLGLARPRRAAAADEHADTPAPHW